MVLFATETISKAAQMMQKDVLLKQTPLNQNQS
jgi:hypothetical protein